VLVFGNNVAQDSQALAENSHFHKGEFRDGYQEEGCKENEKEIRKEGRYQDR